MQSDAKELYRITAARTGKSEQLYKDIGNFVQKEAVDMLKKPKSLIIKLRGVGTWFLRKNRLVRMISYYPPYYEIEGYKDFESQRAFLNFVNKQEMYNIFKARLKDYEEFVKVKNETKKIRNEFNRLSEEQKKSRETGQDNAT